MLVEGLGVGQELSILAFGNFAVADTYLKSEADARFVNATGDTMTGVLGVQVASSSIQARFERTATSAGFFEIGGDSGDAWIWPGGYSAGKGIKFDTAGRLIASFQPSFYANGNGSGYVIGALAFGAVGTNIGGCYNASNGRFTAPVNGTYVFHATALQYQTSNGGMYFRKNGSMVGTRGYGNGGDAFASTHIVLTLAANDYVDVYSEHNVYAGGYSEFCGHLI